MTGGRPLLWRLTAGVGSQGAGLILLTAINLLAVPVLLMAWGRDDYARWTVAMAAAGLLGLADGGLHGYFTSRFRHHWVRGDRAEAERTLRVGLAVYAVPVALAALAAVGFVATGGGVLLAWLALPVVAVIPRGMVSGILAADGRFGVEVWVFLPYLLGQPAAAMIAAGWFGQGPESTAMWVALAGCGLGWGPLALVMWRGYGRLNWWPARPRRADWAALRRHAPLFLLPQGGVVLLTHAPLVLLGRLAGAEAVVLFATLRTFTGLPRQLVQQLAIPVGQELAGLLARGCDGPIERVVRLAALMLGAVAGLAGGASLAIGPPFFRLWSAAAVPFAPLTAGLFLVPVLVAAPLMALVAMLRHRPDPVPLVPGILVQNVGGVALLVPAAALFGVDGAVAALGGAELVAVCGLLWPAAARVLGRRCHWRRLGLDLGLVAVMAGLGWAGTRACLGVAVWAGWVVS